MTTSFDIDRSVKEYTASNLSKQFGNFDEASITALIQMPAVFAYEKGVDAKPKFGRITSIRRLDNRQEIRIDYEIYPLEKFITNDELWEMSTELDLGKNEHWRTHWAVKNVSLEKELAAKGVSLPFHFKEVTLTPINIHQHNFEVAFSFPGEVRPKVEAIAQETMKGLPPNSCFYDLYYQAQLAVPSLDLLLQDIYARRSKLLVVFLCEQYNTKRWPGIEWDAIRSVLHTMSEKHRLMYIRMDNSDVRGVFPNDGYIDGRKFSSNIIAQMIHQRLRAATPLPPKPPL